MLEPDPTSPPIAKIYISGIWQFHRQLEKLSNVSDNKNVLVLAAFFHSVALGIGLYVIIYKKRASEASLKNFWYAYTKATPDNTENREMLFSEMYILTIREGGSGPNTPSRTALYYIQTDGPTGTRTDGQTIR